MKQALFLVLLFCCTGLLAQQPVKFSLDENTVVKDSSGNVYPAFVWQALLRKGSHDLRPEDPKNPKTAFYLVELSEADRARKMEKMGRPRESEAFRTGAKIPLFNATDINGQKLKLKEAAGKIIVMNFWFINCKPCRMEIPDLNELVAQYKGNDKVIFVAIGLDRPYDIKEFLKTTPFHYSIIGDGIYDVQRYRITSYPTHVVIDQEGKVYFHTSGLAPNTVYWVKKSIDELLQKDNKFAAQ